MPTVKLSPLFNSQTLKSTGVPASGHKINTYTAGSSAALATYTDSAGGTPQANPIILNSNGLPDNEIWLQSGLAYKFVWTDENNVVIDTFDNISGINDTTTSTSQWTSSGVTPTYVSTTSFTLPGDQTTEFHVGRRVQCTVTAGTVYGIIKTTAYAALTTVALSMEGTNALDIGLSTVNLSVLRADHSALPAIATATIASATTLNLASAKGKTAHITGSATITGATLPIGVPIDVVFDGAVALTNNATTHNLPGGVSFTTAAGDRARYFYDGTTTYVLNYVFASQQVMTNEFANRAVGTNYTNDTGRNIGVYIVASVSTAANLIGRIGGVDVSKQGTTGSVDLSIYLNVKPGATYQLVSDAGTVTVISWYEDR